MKNCFRIRFTLYLSFLIILPNPSDDVVAQPKGYNYDESKVPDYQLPMLLETETGKRINSPKEWASIRRPQILHHLEQEIYGKNEIPLGQFKVQTRLIEFGNSEFGIRKQYSITFNRRNKELTLNVLVFLPSKVEKPVPVFLGLNFRGNHTVSMDKEIILTQEWIRSGNGVKNNRATQEGRGIASSRWDIKQILSSGYGLITAYYGEIDPDFDDGFKNGIHNLLNSNRTQKPSSGGSIDAWAWGLSRLVDFINTEQEFDKNRIIVIGHSRLGKAALWAGAKDQRIALVISNNSGCGGAAISRRRFGETVKRINSSFPHWFSENYKKYNDREEKCIVDQHSLLSLMAPRPLYVASASDDLWADPYGEFLSIKETIKVYQLYGFNFNQDWNKRRKQLIEPGMSLTGKIGYHLREGKHDVTSSDWKKFIQFAEYNLNRSDKN